MKKLLVFLFSAVFVLGFLATPALATMMPTSSNINTITSFPTNLTESYNESNTDVFYLLEKSITNIDATFQADLKFNVPASPGVEGVTGKLDYGAAYDVTDTGPYGIGSNAFAKIPGDTLTSHLFHFDPTGEPEINRNITASGTFKGEKIFAVIFSDDLLDATDAIFGVADVDYPTDVYGRGWEAGGAFDDTISIAADGSTFTIATGATSRYIDQVRILTYSSVPEPTTLLLLGIGLIGLAGLSRRKFFKK